MNYKLEVVDSFKKDVKKLSKRYKSIKSDLQYLTNQFTKNNPQEIGIPLGDNCYKIRLKNSDNTKGKSGGYRVVYFIIDTDKTITLLSIYSKSDIQNISENNLDKRILEKIKAYKIQ